MGGARMPVPGGARCASQHRRSGGRASRGSRCIRDRSLSRVGAGRFRAQSAREASGLGQLGLARRDQRRVDDRDLRDLVVPRAGGGTADRLVRQRTPCRPCALACQPALALHRRCGRLGRSQDASSGRARSARAHRPDDESRRLRLARRLGGAHLRRAPRRASGCRTRPLRRGSRAQLPARAARAPSRIATREPAAQGALTPGRE